MQNSNLSMDYKAETRKLMERVIQLRIDKLFDNYIPCIKDECDEKHAENLLKSIIIIMINETWINEKIKGSGIHLSTLLERAEPKRSIQPSFTEPSATKNTKMLFLKSF